MKRSLILLATLIASTSLFAQTFIAETYIEQTAVSPKVGSAIGYKFLGKFEVGGFVQRSAETLEAEQGMPLRHENNFYGAFFSYPLLKDSKKFDLNMRVRTGISNEENFAITPSLRASYTPFELLSIGTGVGVRSMRPTFMASIRINLFGNKVIQSVVASADNHTASLSK